jgi:hypothetical protein
MTGNLLVDYHYIPVQSFNNDPGNAGLAKGSEFKYGTGK